MRTSWKLALGLALSTYALPLRADPVVDLINSGAYYVQIAFSSLEAVRTNTSRKDKCRWAHQTQNELNEALGYYERAQLKVNSGAYSADDRAQVAKLVQDTRDMIGKTQELIKTYC